MYKTKCTNLRNSRKAQNAVPNYSNSPNKARAKHSKVHIQKQNNIPNLKAGENQNPDFTGNKHTDRQTRISGRYARQE